MLTLKWFQDGLTKEELSKEYKKLARKYHPDVSNEENAEEAMKEINDEYDRYFVELHDVELGYSADDIYESYQRAREERETILTFLMRDKQSGGNHWYTFNQYGKILTTETPEWENFHGGFALCQLVRTTTGSWYNVSTEQKVSKLAATIDCPDYAQMYFGLKWGYFESESTAIATTDAGKSASLDNYTIYDHVYSERYGHMWLSRERFTSYYDRSHRTRRYVYMLVNGRVMRCGITLDPKWYEEVEHLWGYDMGYVAFQGIDRVEFERTHTVDFIHQFHGAVHCKPVPVEDLYWIDDPEIEHFARLGVIKFYQSKRNFRMRYGTFDQYELENHLHEIDIDMAEKIQDFFDKLFEEFNDAVKGMIKKNKLHVTIGKPNLWDRAGYFH